MAVSTTTPKLFGIPNCDTVKKAQRWLESNDIRYQFHDIRATPLSHQDWQQLVEQVGSETIINKRSTSWRQLSADQQQLDSVSATAELLQQYPTLMKRPLLTPVQKANAASFLIGFKDSDWAQALSRS